MATKPRVKWDFTHPNAMTSPVEDLSGTGKHISIVNTTNINDNDGLYFDSTKSTYLQYARPGNVAKTIPDDGNPFYIKIIFIPYVYNGTMYLINTGMETGSHQNGDKTLTNITITKDGRIQYVNIVWGSIIQADILTSNTVKHNAVNTLIINDSAKVSSEGVEIILNGKVTKGMRSGAIAQDDTGEYNYSKFLVGTSQPSYSSRYSGYIKNIEIGSGGISQKFLLQLANKFYYINSDLNLSECGTVFDTDTEIMQYFENYGESSITDLYNKAKTKLDKPYKIAMFDYNKDE